MLKDNYPVGMSECESVGLTGNCGGECPVFQRGECQYMSMQETIDAAEGSIPDPVERFNFIVIVLGRLLRKND